MSISQSCQNGRAGKCGGSTCADQQYLGRVFYYPCNVFKRQVTEPLRPPGFNQLALMKTKAAMVAALSDYKAVVLVAAEKE